MNLYEWFIDHNNTYLLYILYEITHWKQVKFLKISPYFVTKYQKNYATFMLTYIYLF